MDYFLIHTERLQHKCILPFSVLNYILSEGIEPTLDGMLCNIEAIDQDDTMQTQTQTQTQTQSVILGIDKFAEKDDLNVIEVPMAYLQNVSFVRLTLLTEHIFADRMVLQAETDDFEKQENVEDILVQYIQSNVPVINTGIILEIHSFKIKVISLWQGDKQIDYTSTINHDIAVDFIQSIEATTRAEELKRQYEQSVQEALIKAQEEQQLQKMQEQERKAEEENKGHVLGTTTTIAKTREERLRAFEKRTKN